ncbi:MAG: CU044_5270 family protein [Acidobacteriales bacterium]|nr:CU044_5270 family protein [Terriglobales bacterium]
MNFLQQLTALGHVGDPGDDTRKRVSALFDPEISHSPQRASHSRPPRRRRWMVPVAAAALAVAAPAVLGGPGTTDARASAFLTEVSRNVAAGPQTSQADAAYWYVRLQETSGLGEATVEEWLGHRAPSKFVGHGVDLPESDGSPARFVMGTRSLSWDTLVSLPTNSESLTRVLRKAGRGAGHDVDSQLFTEVGDLLRASPAPPGLRAALYTVGAEIKAVRLIGRTTDALGRAAVAIARSNPDGQGEERYLVDARTGAMLEDQQLDRDGRMQTRITVVTSGGVASSTALPQ